MVQEEIHYHDGNSKCPGNPAHQAGGSCPVQFPNTLELACVKGDTLFACKHLPS